MADEIVYLGRDNIISMIIKEDGVAVNLASVTKMQLVDTYGTVFVDSSVNQGSFDWSEGAGVLHMTLGDAVVPAGVYAVYLIIFDPTNTNGIVWAGMRVEFNNI